ncbi:hypothetical protein [Paenibacillus sp. OK003]|uniref:hypothetical protein n=1 Tax=Paenibacillus sp. OK003 TaxID=1884380 RepID=UPI0008D25061|nr:hypothetical protein [Paenibacillus sp. OK003]SEK70635.1 hypothetical protein SAMN05518856_10444 [Paenibacillus sp. OK003]
MLKTIYRWLYAGLLAKGKLTVLWHKGKRQKPVEKRGKFAMGKTISQRPKEFVFVVSSRGEKQGLCGYVC